MWFKTNDNVLINLNNVVKIYHEKFHMSGGANDYLVITFTDGKQDYISKSDKCEIERLLIKHEQMECKELGGN